MGYLPAIAREAHENMAEDDARNIRPKRNGGFWNIAPARTSTLRLFSRPCSSCRRLARRESL